MKNLKALKNWMQDNREAFFEKYPSPDFKGRRSKARAVWKNAQRFLKNAIEGDCIGGEAGHADSNKTAGEFLSQLQKFI